jgi:membrane protein implicated in regulation of membrane protease activity
MKVEWGEWYYLIYLLPLGLAILLLIASAVMGGDSDGDADGMDADGGDLSGDADFDGDADAGDADGDSDTEASPSLLGSLGFGRASTTLLLQGFMLTWGVVGFYSTTLFAVHFPPTVFIPLSMALAFAFGIFGMALIGTFGSRYMKSVENYAVNKNDLVGEIGVVTFPISETMGRVHVYDKHGTLHVESVRLISGGDPIPKNAKVMLVEYDADKNIYWVEPSPV